VAGLPLRALLAAAEEDDRAALAGMREQVARDPSHFDRFVYGVAQLAARNQRAACDAFTDLEATEWRIAAGVLRALGLGEAGDLRGAIALRNGLSDAVIAASDAASYAADAALLREASRCLMRAESLIPASDRPAPTAGRPFRYVVGYPRSGNTLLLHFLAYTFAEPTYTVYPAAPRYFSRRFHELEPGRAVFVKDHIVRSEYLGEPILSPVRDGRNAFLSLARFLYAEGSSPFVHQGELADFISFVTRQMPYGFWGDHTRALLDARDQGAAVRLIRYEEVAYSHAALLELAREIAGESTALREDEAGFMASREVNMRRLSHAPQWAEKIALPDDSFIPKNWSIGGETSNWERAFDPPARRRFHELGGTESLIRLGYETDENWWR